MAALLQRVTEFIGYSSWTFHGIAKPPEEHPDKVGAYKADYSPLTDEQLAADDAACVDLLAHSREVSR